MRILVTGAGGFIGGWLVEALYLLGYTGVRAGTRKWSTSSRIARFPIELVLCNIMEKSQVERATEGVDAVIHCAYGPREVNVSGTENLLAASVRNGVSRFVHISTIDVYGKVEGTIDESFPFEYTGNEYGDSKIDAEKLCWAYLEKNLPVVVLRPTVVYGPYNKLWIIKFAERLQSGNWGILKDIGEGACNLVYVQDLINAVILSVETEGAVGQAFNINGSDAITWNEYFRRFNAALGLPPLREISGGAFKSKSVLMTPIKATARYVLNHYSDAITKLYKKYDVTRKIMRRAEKSMKTTPGGTELEMFSRVARYSFAKAESILGYKPRFNLDAGLALSVKWLAHETMFSVRREN